MTIQEGIFFLLEESVFAPSGFSPYTQNCRRGLPPHNARDLMMTDDDMDNTIDENCNDSSAESSSALDTYSRRKLSESLTLEDLGEAGAQDSGNSTFFCC